MKILKTKSFYLASILYLPSIFQAVTGIGIYVGDFVIGLFPGAIVYFLWLLFLCFDLGYRAKAVRRPIQIRLIGTIILVWPVYWIMINTMMGNVSLTVSLSPIGGIIFLWVIYVVIDSWIFLSKVIHFLCLEKQIRFEQFRFADAYRITLLFLGGILTIWWLQPLIVKSLNLPSEIANKP